jgi:hypothetical protein
MAVSAREWDISLCSGLFFESGKKIVSTNLYFIGYRKSLLPATPV